MAYFNRFNGIAAVCKVTCNDVCCKHKVFHVVAGKFNHKASVTNLNVTKSSAVDDWSHRKNFVSIVSEQREFFQVLKNPAKILSFWMFCKNLTASHR